MMEILHRGSESVGVEAEMRKNISRFFVVCHENLIPRKDCPPPPSPPPPPSLLFPHPSWTSTFSDWLLHQCSEWTQSFTAITLCHSRGRTPHFENHSIFLLSPLPSIPTPKHTHKHISTLSPNAVSCLTRFFVRREVGGRSLLVCVCMTGRSHLST